MSTVNLQKMTPVVVVEAIEPLLPVYVDRLGFTKVVEVPHEGRLGFVILVRGSIELMFQTVASVAADAPAVAARPTPICLYFDVESLDDAIEAVKGLPVVVARRRASYGADEIFVRDPAGNVLGFARMG